MRRRGNSSKSWRRLRFRLLLQIGFVSLLPIFGLAAWIFHVQAEIRRLAVAEAGRSGARAVRSVTHDLDGLIEHARQLLTGLGQRSDVRTSDAFCDHLFGGVVKKFSGYLDLIAVKPTGQILCSARPRAVATTLLNPDHIRQSVETGNAALGGLVFDRATGKTVITLAVPSVDDTGAVQVVVVAALDLASLTSSLLETPLPDGASLAVVDRRGFILFHYPQSDRWHGELLDDPVRSAVLARDEGIAEGRDPDGTRALFALTPLLRDVDRVGDAVALIAIPKHGIFHDANMLLSSQIGGLLLVVALTLLAGAFAVDRLIERPVQLLSRTIGRVRGGERSALARFPYRWGVAGRLAGAVDELARSLDQHRAKITRLEAALDQERSERVIAGASPAAAPVTEAVLPVWHHVMNAPSFEVRSNAIADEAKANVTKERYWGLAEPAFDSTPNTKFLHLSPNHEAVLQRLTYAVRQRKGCTVLTGEAGCGKSTLAHTLVQRLGVKEYEISLVAHPGGHPGDLLREILYQLGFETPEKDRFDLLHRLSDFLLRNSNAGRDTVIIIDDAQLVDDHRWFEELSLLLNFNTNERDLVTILLVGSPDLGPKVQTVTHLERRVGTWCQLAPLDHEQTAQYVRHRLEVAGRIEPIFTAGAMRLIFAATRGAPRLINDLCDSALMQGHLWGLREIDDEIIRRMMTQLPRRFSEIAEPPVETFRAPRQPRAG